MHTHKQLLRTLVTHIPHSILDAIVRTRRNNAAFRRWSDNVADQFRGRDVTIRAGLAKGLVFNSGHSNVGYTFARSALEPDTELGLLTVLQPGMTFYDIGANFGWLSIIAARLVGAQGKVLSFEPLETNVQIIEHNIRANNLGNMTVLPFALGATDGPASFLLSLQPSWGMLAATGKQPAAPTGETTVAVKQLDTAIREYLLPSPHLIKIDVEGAEVDVLTGAADVIASYRPLMFIELHDTNWTVMDVLQQYGYSACLPGTSVSIIDAPGNVHVFAVPQEREDRMNLLRTFQDPTFPQCARCHQIGTGADQ